MECCSRAKTNKNHETIRDSSFYVIIFNKWTGGESMILALDAGNSTIVVGVYNNEQLAHPYCDFIR